MVLSAIMSGYIICTLFYNKILFNIFNYIQMTRIMWVMQYYAPSGLVRSRLSPKLAPSSRYFSTLYQLTPSIPWLYIFYIIKLLVIILPTLYNLNYFIMYIRPYDLFINACVVSNRYRLADRVIPRDNTGPCPIFVGYGFKFI